MLFRSYMLQNPATVVYASEPEAPRVVQIKKVVDWTPARIEKEIDEQAEKYGVSASEMKRVIKCESQGSTTVQSHWRRPDGTREQSFGLVQIHLPAHKDVTKEEAQNPEFAIEWMAYFIPHFASHSIPLMGLLRVSKSFRSSDLMRSVSHKMDHSLR